MLNSSTQDLRSTCIQFLKQPPAQRLPILKELGIARYAGFLTQIPLTASNVECVMRFFKDTSRVKFPNLRGADLSGLVLDGLNFIRADLSEANLRGSSLVDADLLFANFTGADLTGADLTGATLNETLWSGAFVEQCRLGTGIGLTTEQIRDLKIRGARLNF